MNFPVASYGVSEDRNSMITPPSPCPLPRGEREQFYPAASFGESFRFKGVGNSYDFSYFSDHFFILLQA